MIRILHSDSRYYPLMYCDCCEERITEPGMAMVMFDADPAEGQTCGVIHLHKGSCDRAMQQKVGNKFGWAELSHHVCDLVANIGLPPTKLVEVEKDFSEFRQLLP